MIGPFHRGTAGDSIAIAIPVSTRNVTSFESLSEMSSDKFWLCLNREKGSEDRQK
jgi:hypothetical protein